MTIVFFWSSPIFMKNNNMESNEIKNKMRVKQTLLDSTTDSAQRKKIINQLLILRCKWDIEQIKLKIEMIEKS